MAGGRWSRARRIRILAEHRVNVSSIRTSIRTSTITSTSMPTSTTSMPTSTTIIIVGGLRPPPKQPSVHQLRRLVELAGGRVAPSPAPINRRHAKQHC